MALEARSTIKIGRQQYFPGNRLTPGAEAEVRRRHGFSLLIEEGHLVEVQDETPLTPDVPLASLPTEQDAGSTGPTESAKNADNNEETDRITDGFPCPYCDYIAQKELGLKSHIGRSHKNKRSSKRRKR